MDMVEASYSLEGTDAEWLGRVLESGRPDFDLGRGFYGFTCRIQGKEFDLGPVYVEKNLDPRFGALVEKLNREAPNAVVDVLSRSAAICGGFPEVLGVGNPASNQFFNAGRASGITDAFSVFAQDGEGYGIDISAPVEGVMKTPARVRGIWHRVGLHVAAGMRLRRRLVEQRAELDAILDPTGKVAHAEGTPRSVRSARDALIDSVRRMERARTVKERKDPVRALDLWRGLVAGEWSLVEKWESDGKRYLAAYRNRPDIRDPRALTPHESTVLRYVSLGASNKEVAFALGLSIGSVGSAVSQLIRKFGCKRRTDLLAFASPEQALRMSVPLGTRDEVGVLAIANRRNDRARRKLTITEQEVAEQVIAGGSTAAIARARRTSVHTVSNQIRGMFVKLGVQSRAELVRALTK
jgi:DNA-binding CsgD family transcriptional regulator